MLSQNNLKLSIKCYNGDLTMPWTNSNLDLGFPEIKKVHLQNTQSLERDLSYQKLGE